MSDYVLPTAGNLTTLRKQHHKSEIYGSFLRPEILWSGVANASFSRGETDLTFVSGSGDWGNVESDMPVYVGTSPNAKDIGILRVRSKSSGDGGVTGTLTVARNVFTVNAAYYLSVPNDHPLFPKYPLIVGDPEDADFRKDGDIAYSNQNEFTEPIVVAGPHQANFIDDTLGYWEIQSQLPNSYSTMTGTIMHSYTATAIPNTGVTISIDPGTGAGTIRFSTPGQYWIKYTGMDTLGNVQKTYRFYYAHSTDPTSEHYPNVDFEAATITGDYDQGGWSAQLVFSDNATLADIPDETLGIVWHRPIYDNSEEVITLNPDGVNTLICGYVRQENLTDNLQQGADKATLTLETVQSVLNNHFMFSVSLAAVPGSPNAWFEYDGTLTNGRAVHHLWKWHSNFLQIADVMNLMENTDLRAYAELEDGTLYSMADSLLRDRGIRYHVVSDKSGRVWITPDIQLLTDSERSALDTVFEFDKEDISGEITIVRKPPDTTPFVKTSGFYWDGSFTFASTEECPNPPCPTPEPFCSSAPTTIPSDDGPSVQNYDTQTFRSQAHANEIVGRFYGKANNPYPEVRIPLHGNYSGVLDVAYPLFWVLDINSDDTLRGFSWANKNLIAKNITLVVNTAAGFVRCDAVFEPEVFADPGVAGYCYDDIPTDSGDDDGGDVGDIPIATGASTWWRYLSQPDWEERDTEDCLDLIQDEWWPAKQGSSNPENAILWRSGIGYIKYSTDAGYNWTDVTPATDPPNAAGDSPAPTAGDLTYVMLESNQIYTDEFGVVAKWQNGSGEWRSWIAYTFDDGTTWDWEPLGGTGLELFVNQAAPGWATFVDTTLSEQVDANTMVVIGEDDVSEAFAQLVGIASDGTPTILDTVNFNGYGAINDPRDSVYLPNHDVAIISTAVDWQQNIVNGRPNLQVVRNSAGSISFGAQVFTDSVGVPPAQILVLDDTTPYTVVAIYSQDNFASGTTYYIKKYQYDALTDNFTLINTTTSVEAGIRIANRSQHVAPIYNTSGDMTHAIHLGFEFNSDEIKTQLVSLPIIGFVGSPKTLVNTVGTPYSNWANKYAANKQIVNMEENLLVASYCGQSGSDAGIAHVAFEVNTGTGALTVGTPIERTVSTFSPVVENPTIVKLSSGEILSAYDLDGTQGVFTINVSGTTLIDNADDILISIGSALSARLMTNNIIFISGGTDFGANYTTLRYGGSGEGYGLGISLGKDMGETLYATYFDGSTLKCAIYDILTLVLLGTIDLGSATQAQVESKVRAVWPYSPHRDEDTVVIYGAFTDGTPQAVTQYSSLGASSSILISGATAGRNGYCGSYVESILGDRLAMICGISTKLYVNESPRGVLPDVVDINPHNLKTTAFTAFVASGEANSKMVWRAPSPYNTWGNITSNHGTGEGVWALEIIGY